MITFYWLKFLCIGKIWNCYTHLLTDHWKIIARPTQISTCLHIVDIIKLCDIIHWRLCVCQDMLFDVVSVCGIHCVIMQQKFLHFQHKIVKWHPFKVVSIGHTRAVLVWGKPREGSILWYVVTLMATNDLWRQPFENLSTKTKFKQKFKQFPLQPCNKLIQLFLNRADTTWLKTEKLPQGLAVKLKNYQTTDHLTWCMKRIWTAHNIFNCLENEGNV